MDVSSPFLKSSDSEIMFKIWFRNLSFNICFFCPD